MIILIIIAEQYFLLKKMATDEKRKIFTACTTEINLKQTTRIIHRRKFSFTEVDAGRLKHNNEVVIPRDPSSLGSRSEKTEGVSSN